MSMIVKINDDYELYLKNKWFEYNNTLVKGSLYIGEKLLKGIELAKYLDSIDLKKIDELNKLNGYYVAIRIECEEINIISDRVRTYPMFFLSKDDKVYVSNDAYFLHDKFSNKEKDSTSEKEILLLGYVTCGHTLYKDINQTAAGQILTFKKGKKNDVRYFRFLGEHNSSDKKRKVIKKHFIILENIFKRLIKYANGRTIVIPLSGGYDSRLIAVMLKKLNYQNVITFTYGKKNNPESIVSKRVADNLGFKWIFMPYTSNKTYNWYNSEEYKEYERFADNLSGICLDREWAAVLQLKKQKLIPENSIFVPGHSGDMVAGYSLQNDWFTEEISTDEMVDRIFETNYGMWEWNGKKAEYRDELKERILNTTEINNKEFLYTKNDFYEKWDWEERICKFVVNSVRIYDYFGYDWWLPLCDNEFMEYWFGVSNKYRREKKTYIEHGSHIYSKVARIPYKEAIKNFESIYEKNNFSEFITKKIKNFMKNIFCNTPFERIAKRIYTKLFMRNKQSMNEVFEFQNRQNDWEQTSSRLKKTMYKQLVNFITGRSSFKTLEKLGYINYSENNVSPDVINMLKSLRGE